MLCRKGKWVLVYWLPVAVNINELFSRNSYFIFSNSWVDSLGKTLKLGGIGGRRRRGRQRMRWLNGREFEWTPRVGDGQGGLACFDSWGHKDSDMTERLNWTEVNRRYQGPAFLKCHRDSGAGERHTVWKPPPDHGSSLTFCLWWYLVIFLGWWIWGTTFSPLSYPFLDQERCVTWRILV